MGTKYRNSPIVEAVFEVKFSETPGWDFTIPGVMYSRLSTDFPIKEQRVTQEFTISQDDPSRIKQEVRTSQNMAFLSSDRQRLIQVGEKNSSVHHIKPYKGWEDYFRYDIHSGFSVLNELLPSSKISRLGLRYINHIHAPENELEVTKYLNFYPEFISSHGLQTENFIAGNIFRIPDTEDRCRLQLSNGISPSDKANLFILDLDYYILSSQVSDPQTIFAWADNAHEQIERLFEMSITNASRDLFN